MLIPYRLVQFHLEPDREEARNVGVIVFSETKAVLRLLGHERHRETEPVLYEYLLPEEVHDGSWAFAEWAARWQAIVDAFAGDMDAFEQELIRIEEISAGQWSGAAGGECNFESDFDPVEHSYDHWRRLGFSEDPSPRAADHLFEQLVLRAEMPPLRFLQQVEFFLHVSEVMYSSTLKRDETFAVTVDGKTNYLHFPFVIGDEEPIAVKTIAFQGQRWPEVVGAVNDALFSFDLAVKAGILSPERCLVLSDAPTGPSIQLAERLDAEVTRLDVWNHDARYTLHDLVGR